MDAFGFMCDAPSSTAKRTAPIGAPKAADLGYYYDVACLSHFRTSIARQEPLTTNIPGLTTHKPPDTTTQKQEEHIRVRVSNY